MRLWTHAIVTIGLVMLVAASAAAQLMAPASVKYTPPDPAASSLAAVSNIVYMPVRLAVTTVTAELGGVAAFLNAADANSARDIWGLTEGSAILTPAMYRGDEMFRFGSWQGRMGVLRPREAQVQ
jgi:hypothetical protein